MAKIIKKGGGSMINYKNPQRYKNGDKLCFTQNCVKCQR